MSEKTTKEVNIKLTATDNASGVVAGAKKKMDAELSAIQKLKGAFGEESTLGNLGKIAMGAGAVGALSLVSNAAAQSTARLVELRNEMKAGKLDAFGMADGFAASLPILGGLYTATKNLSELMTGNEFRAQQRVQIEKDINSLLEQRKTIFASIRAAAGEEEGTNQNIAARARQASLSGLDPANRAAAEIRNAGATEDTGIAAKIRANQQSVSESEAKVADLFRQRTGKDGKLDAAVEDQINAQRALTEQYKKNLSALTFDRQSLADETERRVKESFAAFQKQWQADIKTGTGAAGSFIKNMLGGDTTVEKMEAARKEREAAALSAGMNAVGIGQGLFASFFSGGGGNARIKAQLGRAIQNESLIDAGRTTGLGDRMRESARQSPADKLLVEAKKSRELQEKATKAAEQSAIANKKIAAVLGNVTVRRF